jgi:hypothetical protein
MFTKPCCAPAVAIFPDSAESPFLFQIVRTAPFDISPEQMGRRVVLCNKLMMRPDSLRVYIGAAPVRLEYHYILFKNLTGQKIRDRRDIRAALRL